MTFSSPYCINTKESHNICIYMANNKIFPMAASISCVVASRFSFKTRCFTACCGHFVLQDPRKQAITLTAAAFTRHAVSPSRCWPCPQKTWTWTNVCRGKRRVRPEEAPEHLSWGEFTSCSGRWWCACGLRSRTHMGEWESGGFAKLQVWIKSSRCLTVVGSGATEFWWRGKKNKHLHEQLYRRTFTTTLRYSRDAYCKCCVRCLCRLNVCHDQHKIKKLWLFWFLQVYLISASRLVMATPTLDRASDVTCPAWERVARVLTHLCREEKKNKH